jgi:hypothetical protein
LTFAVERTVSERFAPVRATSLCWVRTPANAGGGPPPAPVVQAVGPASAPLDPPELLVDPLVEPVPELLVEPLADPELLPPDPLEPEPEPPPLEPPPGPLLDPPPHANAVDIKRGRPSRATRAERKNIQASV